MTKEEFRDVCDLMRIAMDAQVEANRDAERTLPDLAKHDPQLAEMLKALLEQCARVHEYLQSQR